ncbi:MAG: aspartate--ammonia ligase [Bacilli bacterium]|nr:aspartate--ammonia ligase [Bacilli bacterium]
MSCKDILTLDYQPTLSVFETQRAIKFIKDDFQHRLAEKLKLLRVSAPIFVRKDSGLNDGLNGTERPVSFNVENVQSDIEIVHSLAKWKRFALSKYGFEIGHGLYTDMNAIRKDEKLDFIHSVYVDQWDWEKAITREDRSLSYLKKTVRQIYSCLRHCEKALSLRYPMFQPILPRNIEFISTEELLQRYPLLNAKERENAIAKEYGAVFLYQIGGALSSGVPHDSRAADYDDWSLNGDILVYYPLYDMALELSSMGIRVDADSLRKQLKTKGEEDKLSNAYCQAILRDELPPSIGGGIGQSRICMFLLRKAHIGEVQVSVWPEEDAKKLMKRGIRLL